MTQTAFLKGNQKRLVALANIAAALIELLDHHWPF